MTSPQQIECVQQLHDKLYNESLTNLQQFNNPKQVYDKSTTIQQVKRGSLSMTKIASALVENVQKWRESVPIEG